MNDCGAHEILLSDEANAWVAFNSLKDSGSKDEKELARRHTNACDASTRLRQHISACAECMPKAAKAGK
jgi:hypothetical protein